MKNKN